MTNLLPALIEIGKTLITALASFNWTALFPSFGGLASALVSLLGTLLGFAAAKVAPAPAPVAAK